MRAALLVLCAGAAACDRSDPDVSARNASVSEVAQQVRDASREPGFMRPGRWLSEMIVENIEGPGAPAHAREQMQGMLAQRNAFESCLSPEESRRPSERFFGGGGDQCRYEHFTMGGGRIDARMRCSRAGLTQVMELDGTYSPDAYRIQMATTTEGQSGGASGVTIRMRVDAKRVGECVGEES